MTISNNPFECGQKLKTGFDYFAKGFSKNELVDVFYHLISDRRQGQLLVESAEFCDVDTIYNPGEEINDSSDRLFTSEVMILEAVRVRQFAQTAKTMAALQRVLNKKLESLGDITAGEAIIGKPKKTGLFASVTVQFPLSDGQTLSIIFHSPDGNKMKITASDEILAFRWLLNKRDITVAVAPDSVEEGNLPGLPAASKDVSLEDVGMRCAQLISKNSARFAAKSAELVAAKKLKEELSAQADQLQVSNGQLQQDLAAKVYEDEQAATQIKTTQKQLENQINYNDELRDKLDAMKAAGAGNAGKAGGEDTTGGVSKAEQEAAIFEEKKAAFEQELKGRGFVVSDTPFKGIHQTIYIRPEENQQDVTSSMVTIELNDNKKIFKIDCTGARLFGYNNNGGSGKTFVSKTFAGLDTQIAKALAWIDNKLAEMKNKEESTVKKAQVKGATAENPIELEIEQLATFGTANITDISEENIYIEKDGVFYYAKVMDTEKYSVGIHDFSEPKSVTPPEPQPGTNPDRAEETAAVAILNDILSGKYQTSDEIMPLLEQVAAEYEALGLAEDSPEMKLLDKAADYMTAILDKEAV